MTPHNNPIENLPQNPERINDAMLTEGIIGAKLTDYIHNVHLLENPKEMVEKLEGLLGEMESSGIDSDGMRYTMQQTRDRIAKYKAEI